MTPAAAAQLLLRPDPGSFALVHRPHATGPDHLELLLGQPGRADQIADLPLGSDTAGPPGHELLAVLPYRQVAERGYACPDDRTPLLTLTVEEQAVLPAADLAARLPDTPIGWTGGGFDLDDSAYAAAVRRVVDDEIGQGEGANFVVARSYLADLTGWSPAAALAGFRRLLGRDPGSYWTFLIRLGGRTLLGASPERQVSVADGQVVMNPISGTYGYPTAGADLPGLLRFLADDKEAGELAMVLDEELKMMARICDLGGQVHGPYLKTMARVAHTEYLISGKTHLDVREVLRETLLAPTVTGGPVESACRVIARHEPAGRGYYAGVAALIGRDDAGRRALDSAIVIRTADIDAAGRMRLTVGATVVRDSDPAAEARETRAKADGLLAALRDVSPAHVGPGPAPDLTGDPAVISALGRRNTGLAPFWFADPGGRRRCRARLPGIRVLVVDAEDTFTAMARHLLAALGCQVQVRRFDQPYCLSDHDLVIVGPGPGDPTDLDDPKIAHLHNTTRRLLQTRQPFLAVCLGHQVLAGLLGLPVLRNPRPSQGVQRVVTIFDRPETVGFYNTFAARCGTDQLLSPATAGPVRVTRRPGSDEVDALRGTTFASVQFHPASVLTPRGVGILADLIGDLARPRTAGLEVATG